MLNSYDFVGGVGITIPTEPLCCAVYPNLILTFTTLKLGFGNFIVELPTGLLLLLVSQKPGSFFNLVVV